MNFSKLHECIPFLNLSVLTDIAELSVDLKKILITALMIYEFFLHLFIGIKCGVIASIQPERNEERDRVWCIKELVPIKENFCANSSKFKASPFYNY